MPFSGCYQYSPPPIPSTLTYLSQLGIPAPSSHFSPARYVCSRNGECPRITRSRGRLSEIDTRRSKFQSRSSVDRNDDTTPCWVSMGAGSSAHKCSARNGRKSEGCGRGPRPRLKLLPPPATSTNLTRTIWRTLSCYPTLRQSGLSLQS